MAPPTRAEIEILKLALDPRCLGFNMTVHKQYSSRAMPEVRRWFNDTISIEKSKVPPNQTVRFYEWNIKSDNPNLFEVDGHFYDNIVVILGEEGAHWMFHSYIPVRKPIRGQGCLPVSYCGCCLNAQYTQIVESIKVLMSKQNRCN